MTEKKTNILLFGGGAIGGVYIYNFLQAGCAVAAVLRSNYPHVKQHGFHVDSIRFGCVDFKPTNAVRDINEATQYGPYDFIVVCSKAFPSSKPSLADQIRPAMSKETAVVLIQNGIDIESDVSEAFPDNALLSTVVYLPATQTSPGVIDYGFSQKETLNLLEIGTYPSNAPPSHKAAADHLAELVNAGGGVARVFDDVQTQRWSKLVVNASWNPITALTLCNDANFLRSSPGAHTLVRNAMYEVVDIAQALKVEGITRQLADEHLARHAKRTVGKAPSMLVDVQENRPFEVEAIVGNTVRIAQKAGVKVPLLDALYCLAKGLFVSGETSRAISAAKVDGT
jgi:2-dehydropantoate 2-reductase